MDFERVERLFKPRVSPRRPPSFRRVRRVSSARFGPGRGPVEVPNIRGGVGLGGPGADDLDLANIYGWGEGGARFSDDSDWMSELVLVAKHTYVWLDQLSKRYARPIHRLDEIPEDALRELADRALRVYGSSAYGNAPMPAKRLSGDEVIRKLKHLPTHCTIMPSHIDWAVKMR